MRIDGDWFLLNNFDVIVSRSKSEVVLLAPRHRYEVVPG